MEINPVEYHYQFLAWFSKVHPELHALYADHIVLHLNKPCITLRKGSADECKSKLLAQIIAEFTQEMQPGTIV